MTNPATETPLPTLGPVPSAPFEPLTTPDERNAESTCQAERADFIVNYTRYADIFEAPSEAHEVVATTLISAVVNGNVWIENGGQSLTLDFWTLLLSGSGVGRNTLVSLLWPVIDKAGCAKLVRNTAWGSKQGFYQHLAENPKGFFVWEEVSAALKALSDARFGEAKQWLTDRYDNLRLPPAIQYRISGKDSQTPPIVFTDPPRTNILATSSQDWFINSLNQDDSTGGFIPRWFLVKLPVTDRTIPEPKKPDNSLVGPLSDCLREAMKLKGAVDLSKVRDIYSDWYIETRERFKAQPNQPTAMAFWNRHRVHLLKLAAIYEISQSSGLTVSPAAMERAIQAAKRTERTVFELLPTGMGHEGAAVDKLEQCIFAAGVAGILKSELTRAFQYMKSWDREGRLRTLVEAGSALPFRRKTSGRAAEVLVHARFADEHAKKVPEDERQ